MRRHGIRFTSSLLAGVAIVAGLLLGGCNDLNMFQQIAGMRLEADDPIIPAWDGDVPVVTPADTEITLEFALDQDASVYFGVWPAAEVPSDPASPDFEDITRQIYEQIVDWELNWPPSDTTGTLVDSAVTIDLVEFSPGSNPAVHVIGGLEPQTDYTVVAIGAVTPSGSSEPQLQTIRGIKVLPVTTGERLLIDPEQVDHLALHVSEPAILNGNTARLVVRAETADGLIIPNAEGAVEISTSTNGVELSVDGEPAPDGVVSLVITEGRAFIDVTVDSSVSGDVEDVEFVVTSGALTSSDMVRVVDVTGFAELGETNQVNALGSRAKVSGTLHRLNYLDMDDNDILVLMPGAILYMEMWWDGSDDQHGYIMGMESEIYVLGTEADPVIISGPQATPRRWNGIQMFGMSSGGYGALMINGARIYAPDGWNDTTSQPNRLIETQDGDLNLDLAIANSRINYSNESGLHQLVYLWDAWTGYTINVSLENTIIDAATTMAAVSPGSIIEVDTSAGSGTTRILVDHATIVGTANDGSHDNPVFNDLSVSGTEWSIRRSIIGGDYEPIGMTYDASVTNIVRSVLRYYWQIPEEEDGWDAGLTAQETVVDVLRNPDGSTTFWPSYWGSGPGESFVLDGSAEFPAADSGVPPSMIGALSEGHPNEIGAYANFGYPPPGQ